MELFAHGCLMLAGFAAGWWAKGEAKQTINVDYRVEKVDVLNVQGPTQMNLPPKNTKESPTDA
jgi:hypothetical protein